RANVNVISGVSALSAEGDTKLRAIRFAQRGRDATRLEVDQLLLHQGVVPNVNLAMAAGVAHRWEPLLLCWSPQVDVDGNTSVPGIAIAGDGGGIAGVR